MSFPLQCRCGKLRGALAHPERASRGVCYCKDCQAYGHFLKDTPGVLDGLGGTEVYAVSPRDVSFTEGVEHLTCMSLTDKGLLRWYSSCCQTPIGNTVRDWKVAHVGLVRMCLEGPGVDLDQTFGPVKMRVNTGGAKGKVDVPVWSTTASIASFVFNLARRRLDGSYRQGPFFDADGRPIVSPRVLTAEELAAVRARV